ncbi:MAG TPA: hypothetical protein VLJ79_30805 [Candidatus Binatia bacterium]|nr:hypothetical protein [Candidatus Binatia bacterium]
MNTKKLNSKILHVPGLFLVCAFLTLAGEGHAWSGDRRLRDQIAQYHVFMDEHPKASTQIRENPQLVYDGKFLKRHSEVERFLKARPELRQEIARRPGRVFGWYDHDDYRYSRYDRDDRRFGRWRH